MCHGGSGDGVVGRGPEGPKLSSMFIGECALLTIRMSLPERYTVHCMILGRAVKEALGWDGEVLDFSLSSVNNTLKSQNILFPRLLNTKVK